MEAEELRGGLVVRAEGGAGDSSGVATCGRGRSKSKDGEGQGRLGDALVYMKELDRSSPKQGRQ